MLTTATLLVLLAAVGGSFAQDYCSLCPDHTMCVYPEVGAKCGSLLSSGTSSEDVDAIVNAHNELRARVASGQEGLGANGWQPQAANMKKMVWDDELARVAQRWANQCDFRHDECRTVDRFSVGQNIYMAGSSDGSAGADWRAAVQAWYDEVKDFDRNSISPYQFSYETGHYTQLVWADTSAVGCGFAKFDNGWTWSYYVCNYGPAGNMIEGSMYEEGSPCSRCEWGRTCENDLCS